MLIISEGTLSAILDWECVAVVGRWKACQVPEFLVGRPRDQAPTPRIPEDRLVGLSEEDPAEWVKEQG